MPITPDDRKELPAEVIKNIDKHLQAQEPQTDALGSLLQAVNDSGQYIPWEKVQLPSKGQYYDGKMPEGYIEVRPFSIDVDKMTSNQRLVASGELLNKIVEVSVRFPDPSFSVYDLLAGDQHFLLYYLRGITHGPEYEFALPCPFCEQKGIFEYNLGDLVKTMKGPNKKYPDEPMPVLLPQLSLTSGKEVMALIKLVRVRDIAAMSTTSNAEVWDPVNRGRARAKGDKKESKAKANPEKAYLDGMKMQIEGFRIDGVDFSDIRKNDLVNKLHQKDAAAIRDFIEQVSPGIDTTLEVTCQNSECGKEYAVQLPFGENFFRSTR